jgi:hypothetical protein
MRVNPAEYFAEQVCYYGPEGGEDGDADCNDAAYRTRSEGSGAGPSVVCGAELRGLAELRGRVTRAESVADGGTAAALTLRAEVEAGALIVAIFAGSR